MLLHLALASDWRNAVRVGRYAVSTLGATVDEVGFMHCCRDEAQLAGVHERFYGEVREPLVVLVIGDVAPFGLRVVDEPPFPGSTQTFPHVYGGDLPVEAVAEVRPYP